MPRRQLVKLALLAVRQFLRCGLDRRPALGRLARRRLRRRSHGRALPHPVRVAAEILLRPAASFEHDGAGDDIVEERANRD